MNSAETEMSARYFVAEASIWILGGILVVSRFVGLAPDQPVPVLNITPERSQHFPRIVAALLLAAVLYMIVEWKQSTRTARRSYWALARAIASAFVACTALYLSYPLVAQNTRFAGISPAWYLGFAVIGVLLGTCASMLTIAALMIRSREQAKKLRLPRIPIAAGAQFVGWFPLMLLLMGTYYSLLSFSPAVLHAFAGPLVAIPCVLVLLDHFASFWHATDENGDRIPLAKRVAAFRDIHDFHDYQYLMHNHGKEVLATLDIPPNTSPAEIQHKIRETLSAPSSPEPFRFHVEQLDEIQIEFYRKDGNPQNHNPTNSGVRVRSRRGPKDLIRVLVIPEDTRRGKRTVALSAAAVEKYADRYIEEHSDPADMTFRKVLSYAVNQAALLSMTDEVGPLLHRFVQSGQEAQVKELVRQHAEVNERAEAGWTPLLYACAQGYPRIARILLDAGANPDLANVNGITPLHYGARYGNLDICRLLLEYGVALDKPDVYGMTPLIVASRDGHIGIVKFLLHAGADSSLKTADDKTALDLAYERGHGQIAKILRKAKIERVEPREH